MRRAKTAAGEAAGAEAGRLSAAVHVEFRDHAVALLGTHATLLRDANEVTRMLRRTLEILEGYREEVARECERRASAMSHQDGPPYDEQESPSGKYAWNSEDGWHEKEAR